MVLRVVRRRAIMAQMGIAHATSGVSTRLSVGKAGVPRADAADGETPSKRCPRFADSGSGEK